MNEEEQDLEQKEREQGAGDRTLRKRLNEEINKEKQEAKEKRKRGFKDTLDEIIGRYDLKKVIPVFLCLSLIIGGLGYFFITTEAKYKQRGQKEQYKYHRSPDGYYIPYYYTLNGKKEFRESNALHDGDTVILDEIAVKIIPDPTREEVEFTITAQFYKVVNKSESREYMGEEKDIIGNDSRTYDISGVTVVTFPLPFRLDGIKVDLTIEETRTWTFYHISHPRGEELEQTAKTLFGIERRFLIYGMLSALVGIGMGFVLALHTISPPRDDLPTGIFLSIVLITICWALTKTLYLNYGIVNGAQYGIFALAMIPTGVCIAGKKKKCEISIKQYKGRYCYLYPVFYIEDQGTKWNPPNFFEYLLKKPAETIYYNVMENLNKGEDIKNAGLTGLHYTDEMEVVNGKLFLKNTSTMGKKISTWNSDVVTIQGIAGEMDEQTELLANIQRELPVAKNKAVRKALTERRMYLSELRNREYLTEEDKIKEEETEEEGGENNGRSQIK